MTIFVITRVDIVTKHGALDVEAPGAYWVRRAAGGVSHLLFLLI
jgi:hypothetical protein